MTFLKRNIEQPGILVTDMLEQLKQEFRDFRLEIPAEAANQIPSTLYTLADPLSLHDPINRSIIGAFKKLKESEFYEAGSTSKEDDSAPVSKAAYKAASIIVNQRQRGNPLLKAIHNVPWEYGEIVPDYVMGHTCCALFLSLKYHNLNPQYIHERLKDLGRQYELRILLVQVDIRDPYVPIKELTKICLLADLTLLLAWSAQEAGKIIETYKVFEHKPPDLIMEKPDASNGALSKIADALTSIKSINRTDATTLLSNFKTLEKIFQASEEDLSLCPGIGPLKAKRLYRVLHEKFIKESAS
nr:EOG090X0BTB [Macrothrix elegans]